MQRMNLPVVQRIKTVMAKTNESGCKLSRQRLARFDEHFLHEVDSEHGTLEKAHDMISESAERHIRESLSAYAVSVCQRSTDMFVCQNFAIQSWQEATHDVGSAVLCGAHGIGYVCSNALLARLHCPLRQPTAPSPESAAAVVKVV